jgi:hypothetical protein
VPDVSVAYEGPGKPADDPAPGSQSPRLATGVVDPGAYSRFIRGTGNLVLLDAPAQALAALLDLLAGDA